MDTAYRTSWIRRIGPIGYGVLGYSGTVYWGPWVRRIGSLGTVFCTSWVRRIELLGYGVLAESVLFLIFDQSIIYGVYTDVDTAYSSKSGGTDNQEKDEKQSQNDKTRHGMEKL
ncbi:hypothetical protein Tco_0892394 [Tanacetum coccineum]|uniref:Uncharacterized protein n=1 Tax=Tanacetum coccineum TaxID=301880 RepID=A0ABQ5C8K8_9ASTR